MADSGFTIKDMLTELGSDLNIPPFMEERQQQPAEEVQEGQRIASLRIHVDKGHWEDKEFQCSDRNTTNFLGSTVQPDSVRLCLLIKFPFL